MGSDSELIRLEEYIERLLAGYTKLKKEKQNIEQRLVELQAENDKYKQELDSFDSERGVMRDRVNSLIGQIEQWETEIDEEGGAEEAADDGGAEDESEEDPEDEEPPLKKEKRLTRGPRPRRTCSAVEVKRRSAECERPHGWQR